MKTLTKRKKIFIIAGFCLLLVGTGVLNLVLNNQITSEIESSVTVTTSNFFSTYRSDRSTTRSEEILYLDAIIASASTSADSIAAAEAQRAELIALMELELSLEALIKAKGFEDVVVSTSSSNINVIVQSAELDDVEVAQIVEIIVTQTDYAASNVKIFPVE